MRVVCSICGKSEVVYEFPLQIDLSRRKTKTKALCKQCFNEYIMDKAFSEFDKLDLHSPKSVLVAYSGECDSAFMLTLLQEYKKQRNLDFTIYPTLVCHNSSKVAISRDKTARQLTTLLGVPLKVLNAKDIILNQRIIAENAQFTGIAAGQGVGFTTGLLHLRKGLGMRETPIRPHS